MVYLGNILLEGTMSCTCSEQQALRNPLESSHQYKELTWSEESSKGAIAF